MLSDNDSYVMPPSGVPAEASTSSDNFVMPQSGVPLQKNKKSTGSKFVQDNVDSKCSGSEDFISLKILQQLK